MTGGGTTEAYELVIRYLAQEVQSLAKQEKCDIKPVIVMPVPTYGFFFENARNWGFEIEQVQRDMANGGKLDPAVLADVFEKLDRKGKRVIAFFDSNPHNPLGLVRDEEETAALYRVIHDLSETYQNNHNRKFKRMHWDDSIARVRIIDDMVYAGLEYPDAGKAFPFGALNHEDFHDVFRDVFTLVGPSKAGLVNIRAGMVIGPSKDIRELRQIQKTTSYAPSDMVMHTLEAYFSDDKAFTEWRLNTLDKAIGIYRANGLLMKAIINGFENIEASDEERKNIIETYARAKKISDRTARRDLAQGIDGVDIVTSPNAGFFHVLNFSQCKGKFYDNFFTHKQYGGVTEFKDEYGVEHLANAARLKFASGTWMGLDIKDCFVRASFALPIEKIVDFGNRVRWMTKQLGVKGHSLNS